jgi:hypothetical protein
VIDICQNQSTISVQITDKQFTQTVTNATDVTNGDQPHLQNHSIGAKDVFAKNVIREKF